MESHIRTLGILHIILGSLGLIGALVVLMVFGGLAGLVGMSAERAGDAAVAMPFLGGLGLFIAVLILVFSLPGFIGGIGLLKLAPWSRIFMIVISVLDLLHVPLGTALGIYGLWVLTNPQATALFERRRFQPGY
jgi:hypothetical protein